MNNNSSPFGPAIPVETKIIPTVEVNAATDELVIHIPGAQLMALQQPKAEKPEPKQKAPDDENIIVLVHEEAGQHKHTWLCDLSRSDSSIPEHEILLMAIFGAMSSPNNTLEDISTGMLLHAGGTSKPAQLLHAAPPCYVDCCVTLRESK